MNPRGAAGAAWRPYPGGALPDARGELLEHRPVGGVGIPARPFWLYAPAGAALRERRPLLVLLDGQNLFDDRAAFAGRSWRIAAALDAFEGEPGGAPWVVGVANAGTRRIREYAPFRDRRFGGGGARLTLRFLLAEVVPRVARAVAVARRRDGEPALGVGGSSLGGSFALWALFASRGAFERVLAMSPTTRFAGEALRGYLRRQRHRAARLYLDCGLAEGRRRGLRFRPAAPSAYVRRVRRLSRALEEIGYVRGRDLVHVEAPGGEHTEHDWGARFPGALAALYG